MATQYTVYVDSSPPGEGSEQRQRLREMLGLSDAKLNSLLRRLPGEVTRPVSESTALSVARRFRRAGLHAFVRPVTTGEESESAAPDLHGTSADPAERGPGFTPQASEERDDARTGLRATDTRGGFEEPAPTSGPAKSDESDADEFPATDNTDSAARPTSPHEGGAVTGFHSGRPESTERTAPGGGSEDSFGFEDEDDWASQFTTSWRSSPRDGREQSAHTDRDANSRGASGVSSAGKTPVDEPTVGRKPAGRGAGAGDRRELSRDPNGLRPEAVRAESERADAGSGVPARAQRTDRDEAARGSGAEQPDGGPRHDGGTGASRPPAADRTVGSDEADYDSDELFRSAEPVGPKAPSKVLVVALIIVLALLTALLLLF